MLLTKPQDIFEILPGGTVSKRNLFDLVQFSKVKGSEYWGGSGFRVGNTPQQGINWIGPISAVRGVVIKTRPGSYADDGWLDEERTTFRYSFKARKGVVSYSEGANRVLIDQPQHLYPVLLFTEDKAVWRFEGRFSVSEIADLFVVLIRHDPIASDLTIQDEMTWREGGRRYVTHLLVERSRSLIEYLKTVTDSVCDICSEDFSARYGVAYVEAHHKTPVSIFTEAHEVRPDDLALLCPNCHKAVHIYMKQSGAGFEAIKQQIRSRAAHSSAGGA